MFESAKLHWLLFCFSSLMSGFSYARRFVLCGLFHVADSRISCPYNVIGQQ